MRKFWIVVKAITLLWAAWVIGIPMLQLGDTGTAFLFLVGGLWMVWGVKAPFRYVQAKARG